MVMTTYRPHYRQVDDDADLLLNRPVARVTERQLFPEKAILFRQRHGYVERDDQRPVEALASAVRLPFDHLKWPVRREQTGTMTCCHSFLNLTQYPVCP